MCYYYSQMDSTSAKYEKFRLHSAFFRRWRQTQEKNQFMPVNERLYRDFKFLVKTTYSFNFPISNKSITNFPEVNFNNL